MIEDYDYEEEYRGYCICVDMSNGHYIAFDKYDTDKLVASESNIKWLKEIIDFYLIPNEKGE